MKLQTILLAGLVLSACAATTPITKDEPASDPTAASDNDWEVRRQHMKARLDEQFLRQDFNGDGRMTGYEFKEYQKAHYAKWYDADGDGTLALTCSTQRFSALMKNFGSRHPAWRDCLGDSDADATIIELTFDDYYRLVSEDFNRMDVNRDGLVTRSEFGSFQGE